MNRLRRMLSLFVCIGLFAALSGCSAPATPPKEQPAAPAAAQQANANETVSFTDSTGRTVQLPKKIERVASAGPLANIAIYAINPDTLVGWAMQPSPSTKGYIDPKFDKLPVYGKFYGQKGNFNREALMASNPQVVIDFGQWDENYKRDLDKLQEQIGIPVICLDGTLQKNAESFRMLGKLLGNPEKGNAIANYTDRILKEVKEQGVKIPADKRLKIYCGQGKDALSTIIQHTLHTEAIEYVGGDVVVDKNSAQLQRGGGTVSLEQVLAWNPDIILFTSDSIYDKVKNDPSWAALKAIKDNKYYEIPDIPYNWLNRPPGPNRIIGLVWLSKLLYPDVYNFDVVKETQEFYKIMYNKTLSENDVHTMLAKSTFKKN